MVRQPLVCNLNRCCALAGTHPFVECAATGGIRGAEPQRVNAACYELLSCSEWTIGLSCCRKAGNPTATWIVAGVIPLAR
jgi:hypothetical protein